MSPAERRLVIAAESLGGADAALSLCPAILGWAPARPSGLIIEPEDNDFWSGRDPKIVSTRGTLMARPTVDRLQRLARRDASEFGARLSSLAKALNTEWDCALAAGDLVTAACAGLSGEDILLLGQRAVFRHLSRVALLGGEPGPSEAARALADALARASRTSVALLSAGSHADDESIASLVERTHAVALVLDLEAGPVTGEESLRRLYIAARCPIVALGAARLGQPSSKASSSRRDRRGGCRTT
ncbi:hypothetical protein [Jannaschia seohaensis]|uniref:Universal stress protein family protein n=1 Tax=Jannaschia seohaensis TaxID=475081 RepID=A0A2Y9AXE6_9RHOB|nr:hypothetical protein [Jannaschia seohaensis]PWJ16121.1 hypothetical protein BCF38_1094 [Jannaschia seohaensis]SSA48984.1 hypothetical protein SAMN05421539_1094 [Jannaschia seohaensis]